MRKSKSGFAVAGIAIMRAVDERICYNSYARRFVPGWLYDSSSEVIILNGAVQV